LTLEGNNSLILKKEKVFRIKRSAHRGKGSPTVLASLREERSREELQIGKKFNQGGKKLRPIQKRPLSARRKSSECFDNLNKRERYSWVPVEDRIREREDRWISKENPGNHFEGGILGGKRSAGGGNRANARSEEACETDDEDYEKEGRIGF